VVITEIDPICALQAAMEGYQVATLDDMLETADIFITTTGNKDVITASDIARMKHQAIVGNIGHFDNEIDMVGLMATPDIERVNIKPQVDKWVYPDGRASSSVEGRLLNLGNATGPPSFVMSKSFTNQTMAQMELYTNEGGTRTKVYLLPKHLDEKVARLHLDALGVRLTTLTPRQAEYIGVPVDGPYKPEHLPLLSRPGDRRERGGSPPALRRRSASRTSRPPRMSTPTTSVTRYEGGRPCCDHHPRPSERLNAWTATMNAEVTGPTSRPPSTPGRTGDRGDGRPGAVLCRCGVRRPRRSRRAAAPTTPVPRTTSPPGLRGPGRVRCRARLHFGIDKPILAAINGPVAGIGFRALLLPRSPVRGPGAKFTTAHGKLGLPCAFGLAWLLPRTHRVARHSTFILSSRTFDADEAHALGLVTSVSTARPPRPRPRLCPDAGHHGLPRLNWQPRSARSTRHSTCRPRGGPGRRALLDPMMAGPDYREGVAALREKRPPALRRSGPADLRSPTAGSGHGADTGTGAGTGGTRGGFPGRPVRPATVAAMSGDTTPSPVTLSPPRRGEPERPAIDPAAARPPPRRRRPPCSTSAAC